MKNNQNVITGLQKYFLLTILIILIITFFRFLSPFLGTLFIAGVIVTAIYPLKSFIEHKFKLSATLSSLITFFIILLLTVLTVVFFFVFIVAEASDAYLLINKQIETFIEKQQNSESFFEDYPFIKQWTDTFVEYNPVSLQDIVNTAGDFVGTISGFLIDQTKNVLKQLSIFLLHILVFVFAIFYFLRDGHRGLNYVRSLVPLSEKHKTELFKKIHNLMHSIMLGTFGAAIAQGSLVALGFVFVGIKSAAFWGLLAAIFSPIPYLGASIVWFPAVVSLYIGGHFIAGTFLLIWGALVVGLVDNIIKPYLIGSSATLHPFAVLLVLLGGVFTFGFKGLIFGPVILTLTLSFLHIYQLEYYEILKGKK